MRPFGLVLAGGRAQRMGGGNKPLLPLGRGTLLSTLLRTLAPQCSSLAINAPEPETWQAFDAPVLADPVDGFAGPLAGVLAGLLQLRAWDEPRCLLTVPGDTPFVPSNLVERLSIARDRAGTRIACASSGGRVHPVVALWSVDVIEALAATVRGSGSQSVLRFQQTIGFCAADWPTEPCDPFFNVNTPEALVEAERIAATIGAA